MKCDNNSPTALDVHLAGCEERVKSLAEEHGLEDVFAFELFKLRDLVAAATKMNTVEAALKAFEFEHELTDRIQEQAALAIKH